MCIHACAGCYPKWDEKPVGEGIWLHLLADKGFVPELLQRLRFIWSLRSISENTYVVVYFDVCEWFELKKTSGLSLESLDLDWLGWAWRSLICEYQKCNGPHSKYKSFLFSMLLTQCFSKKQHTNPDMQVEASQPHDYYYITAIISEYDAFHRIMHSGKNSEPLC